MVAYESIIFDDKETIYSTIEEVSIIQELLEKLSDFSKEGNLLASKLYNKYMMKLLMYYNIYKVLILF